MLNVTSAKITGNPDSPGWVQVFDQEFFHIVVAGKNSLPSDQNFFLRFKSEYLKSSEFSPLNALKGAVEKVAGSFGEEIEIVAAVFINNVVYTVAVGGAQARILRGEVSAKILDSHLHDRTLVSASGFPQDGDVFILENRNHGGMTLKFQKSMQLPVLNIPKPVFHPRVLLTAGSVVANFIAKKLPKPPVYVRQNQVDDQAGGKKRQVTFAVGVILAILLIVSIIFGIRQKNQTAYKNTYQTRLDQAGRDYDQALGLLTVEPQKARELFMQSRTLANELQAEKIKDDRLDYLVANLAAQQGQILGEYVTNPSVFMDLSIQTSGFAGSDLASSGEILFILDKNTKKIIQVEIATKKTQMAAGPDQIDTALGLTTYEDRVFIVNSTGVYELGDTKKQSIVKDWTGDVLVYAYAGNLYLLDKSGSMIWRYVGSDTGFAAKQQWLGTGVTPDFSTTTALTIDGSIYTLTSNGKILKFTLGSPQNFNLPEEVNLQGATAIYTNGDLQYFYILNPHEKKIYVVTKTGDYKGVYQSDLLGSASGLVVSEKDKKIIFLAGSKLYSIDIQHL